MPKKSTDEKIDELAQMVAHGFRELRDDLRKEMQDGFAEVHEDIAGIHADLESIHATMATKADLKQFDKTLDLHQAQIDGLARRTKDLEVAAQ